MNGNSQENKRLAIPRLERERVLSAADWRCQLGDCGRDLTDCLKDGIVPKLSHIVAASDQGPRSNPAMPVAERNKATNLMALCDECARKIDSPEGIAIYTVERLRQAKLDHETKYAARRGNEPWRGPLGTIMYLNIARLSIDARSYGYRLKDEGINVALNASFDDMSTYKVGVRRQHSELLAFR